MAYSLENTADLTNLANAIRSKTGDTEALTIKEMENAIKGLTGTTPTDTQLKRIHWNRTGTVSIGKNSSKSFNISTMNSNKRYPFVFFTKVITSGSSGGYPPFSVFVIYDGTQNTWTYQYPTVNFSGSVVFNNDKGVLTLTNNTGVSYDMRFSNTTNPSGNSEEYAELFYFCPVEEEN